jgi:hypothetical protein
MLIHQVLSGAAAAVVGAAVVLAVPGFSPSVEAQTSNPAVKTDRLDYRPLGTACSERAWPYYGPECLRDRREVAGKARVVRIVSIDRLSN